MLLVFLVSILATVCVGRPYGDEEGGVISRPNVVSVSPNCPAGQEWINGACRDIWLKSRLAREALVALLNLLADGPRNVVTVPPNCPSGQQWINGACRDVFPTSQNLWDDVLLPHNVVTVPINCPTGQQWINGACRDIWNRDFTSLLRSRVAEAVVNEFKKIDNTNFHLSTRTKDAMRNVITVPDQCPSGSRPDALGICRPIFD